MPTETNFRVRPSKKLGGLLDLYNSPNAAASAFGIPYMTLTNWLADKGDIPSRHIAAILERTKLPYDELFIHREER